jgi:hypothetical protein
MPHKILSIYSKHKYFLRIFGTRHYAKQIFFCTTGRKSTEYVLVFDNRAVDYIVYPYICIHCAARCEQQSTICLSVSVCVYRFFSLLLLTLYSAVYKYVWVYHIVNSMNALAKTNTFSSSCTKNVVSRNVCLGLLYHFV